MAAKDSVGRYGEWVAAGHLTDLGMQIVARNWRSPDRNVPGELDIIALDGTTAVIVEVKTRRSISHGTALEAVTRDKLLRLRRLAAVYLSELDDAGTTLSGGRPSSVRIDVVAVQLPRAGAAVLSHVSAVG